MQDIPECGWVRITFIGFDCKRKTRIVRILRREEGVVHVNIPYPQRPDYEYPLELRAVKDVETINIAGVRSKVMGSLCELVQDVAGGNVSIESTLFAMCENLVRGQKK